MELAKCSTSEWGEALRAAAGVAIATVEVPDDVAANLLGGRFAVPETAWPSAFAPSQQDRSDFDAAAAAAESGDESSDEEVADYETFPEFEAAVDAAIAAVGGAALPKLSWSAPKDAAWMSCDGTLRCTRATEVLLLLRASDYAAADIDQARALGLRPVLALKQWRDVAPASEFRCFVLGGALLAVCQRHLNERFPSVEARRAQMSLAIARFVRRRLLLALPCADCVVDVCVDGDDESAAVSLVDIAPLDEAFLETAPSLVTWDELQQLRTTTTTAAADDAVPAIRLVDASMLAGVQPGPRNLCGIPVELRDATSMADIEEAINAMQRETHRELQQQHQQQL